MYARRYEKKDLTFDFAMGLLNDNLLFVDRETRSIWSQLDGKAVSGPMKERPLKIIPSRQTTWKHWLALHPATRVLEPKGEKGRPYFYRNRRPGAPAPKERSNTHDISALGLGLNVGDKTVFFPLTELARAKLPLKYTAGGENVFIHYKKNAMTAWALDAEGALLPAVLAYREGWMAFNPESEVFKAK